jgi:hypothetical protein
MRTLEQEQKHIVFGPREKEGIFMSRVETPPTYRFVDDIPELAEARLAVRLEAQDILAKREEQQLQSETALLPLDALSTAEYVLAVGAEFDVGHPQYEEARTGLKLDCLRLVSEWYRKLRPEYFEPLRHTYDTVTEQFYSHGLSVEQMTYNALVPIADDPEEESRRVNERVEDATPGIMRKLGGLALGSIGIRTISECTDKAIADYSQDQKRYASYRGYGGYVPDIEKVMIRDIRIDEATGDRLQEQVGLPGIFITHDIIQRALAERGIAAKHLDKTDLHGAQLLVEDDLMAFVQLLDAVASREWCTNIFMGEEVAQDFIKDYPAFWHEAKERQRGLHHIAEKTTAYVLDLAAEGFDKRKAPAKVEAFVKLLLLNEAKRDVGLAEQIFDARTAIGLVQVNMLESQGRYIEAQAEFEAVFSEAPGGGYCSGGSCGLESVDDFTDEGKQLRDKLKAEGGDIIVKDKDRSCKCGQKTVAYAYNERKVNKYCTSCKAFESKRT